MKTLTNTGGLVVEGVEGGGRTEYFFQENWRLNPLDFSDDKQQKPTLVSFSTKGGHGSLSDETVFESRAQY